MIQEKLEHYVKEIKRKFHLRLVRPIPEIVVTDQLAASMDTRSFGTIIENSVIKLSKEFLSSPLLEGILIREAMRLFIPEKILLIEEAMDIAMFAAYKLLPKKEEWFSEWTRLSPQKFLGDVRYWPTYDYIEFDKATAGMGIKILLDLLEEITKYRKEFRSEEYIYFFDYVQKEVFTPLTETDVELIEILGQSPLLSFSAISKLTGKSKTMTRRVFKKLEKRIWLRTQAYLNWSRLGLEHIGVLIKPVGDYKEVREKLVQPYIRKIHVLGGGRTTELLAYYTLPTGTDYILDEFLRSIKEEGLIQRHVKMLSQKDIQMICFKHYDVKEKTWNIPWKELEERFSIPIERSEITLPTEVVELDYVSMPKQFDHIDLKILESIYREKGLKRTIKELTKDVGISRAELSRRLDRLQKEKFFTPRLTFLPLLCGLPETLLLIAESDNHESIMKIENVLRYLPLTYLLKVRGDLEGLVSLSSLPGRLVDAYKTLAVQIAELPQIDSTRLYIEHQATMISRFMPIAELYEEHDRWVHPREIWDSGQI